MKVAALFLAILILTPILSVQAESIDFGNTEGAVQKTVEILKKVGQKVLMVWEKAHRTISRYWGKIILPKIKGWFEEKKPVIEKEFEKEKTELKEDSKKTFSKVWEWIVDLVR